MITIFEDWIADRFPPQNHPEQSTDEIYMGNIKKSSFANIGHTSKRLGVVALKANRSPMDALSQSKIFPLFVQRAELENYFYVQAQQRLSR